MPLLPCCSPVAARSRNLPLILRRDCCPIREYVILRIVPATARSREDPRKDKSHDPIASLAGERKRVVPDLCELAAERLSQQVVRPVEAGLHRLFGNAEKGCRFLDA